MLSRFFRWIRAIFHRGMDKLEDPEIMLDQARREMSEAMAANKEKAVQAITQKNKLQRMLEEQEARSADLEAKATLALKQGNRDLARQFIREKQSIDVGLEGLRTSYQQAVDTVEAVKTAIRRQEEDIRRKTSEALALKAQWKQAQIQSAISKTLEGLTFENEFESTYGSAKEKIKDKMAEAQARSEMFGASVQGKVMQMEDVAMDGKADEELRQLEERLGLVKPTETVQPVQTVSNADDELDALEKRLSDGNSSNPA